MSMRAAMAMAILLITEPAYAGTSHWAASDDPTAVKLVAAEAMWAKLQCGPEPEMAAYVADDFQGTGSHGTRYGRADAIEQGNNRDCKVGTVNVHFLTDNVAILYGDESRIVKRPDGTEERRCQVWTDTWLQRKGKWQVVAAQDTLVPCEGK